MDFEEYVQANYKRLEGQTRELVEDAFKAGKQSKQAEIDALQQQNQRLAMRLDVIQGALQKQIDLIVELKNDT